MAQNMTKSADIAESHTKLEALIIRLQTASQAVDLELNGDEDAIAKIEEKERLYQAAFVALERLFLEATVNAVTERTVEIDESKLDVSTESALLPRELFPVQTDEKRIIKKEGVDSIRQMTNALAEKLRTNMNGIKSSMRRSSF